MGERRLYIIATVKLLTGKVDIEQLQSRQNLFHMCFARQGQVSSVDYLQHILHSVYLDGQHHCLHQAKEGMK